MSDLDEFLLARIGEDEADAREAESRRKGELWVVTGMDDAVGVDYNPARVLAKCEAKRRIVEMAQGARSAATTLAEPDADHVAYAITNAAWLIGETTLKLLAQPYADHPDFDPTWRVG